MKILKIIPIYLCLAAFMLSCEKEEIVSEKSIAVPAEKIDLSSITSNGIDKKFIPSQLTSLNKESLEMANMNKKIAIINGSSPMFNIVAQIVNSNTLGTITFLTTADVLNGTLINGNFDLFFLGRSEQSFITPDGFREQLELALNSGIGMITEWNGGSPVWTELGDQNNYYQVLDYDGSLYGWFSGNVDRGDIWAGTLQTNIAPNHEVMSGIPSSYSICGSEFFFRIQNPDPKLEILATVQSGNLNYPLLMAGKYNGKGKVVLWLSDWMDCGISQADPVRDQIIKNAILYVGIQNDSDNDGCINEDDPITESNMEATVVLMGCDSGVGNRMTSACGIMMSDLIDQLEARTYHNHGGFVKEVAQLTATWLLDELITQEEKDAIVACAGQSK